MLPSRIITAQQHSNQAALAGLQTTKIPHPYPAVAFYFPNAPNDCTPTRARGGGCVGRRRAHRRLFSSTRRQTQWHLASERIRMHHNLPPVATHAIAPSPLASSDGDGVAAIASTWPHCETGALPAYVCRCLCFDSALPAP